MTRSSVTRGFRLEIIARGSEAKIARLKRGKTFTQDLISIVKLGGDEELIACAIEALAEMNYRAAIPLIAARLDDPSLLIASTAFVELEEMGGHEVSYIFAVRLERVTDEVERSTLIRSLVSLGSWRSVKSNPNLSATELIVCLKAMEKQGEIHDESFTYMCSLLESDHSEVRDEALYLLARHFGQKGQDALIKHLQSLSAEAQHYVAERCFKRLQPHLSRIVGRSGFPSNWRETLETDMMEMRQPTAFTIFMIRAFHPRMFLKRAEDLIGLFLRDQIAFHLGTLEELLYYMQETGEGIRSQAVIQLLAEIAANPRAFLGRRFARVDRYSGVFGLS